MMNSPEIRQHFLNFFKSKSHTIVPSAPIVIKNDPTLLFTNAGMNQFKDYFLGNRIPEHRRIADTQKCLRVSGKHNDLEEVGVDTYHHTMFEMLGNWSFGDYFKKEAIAWSWELLTDVYKLDKERIYVTVFEGDDSQGIPRDDEAYNEWMKYVPASRLLLGNKKDNFWEMGDTGPCGPSSEIHFDSRTDSERSTIDGSSLVNKDHPQVIEIWNNVFIQFNRLKDGSLQLLPEKHVDTGMGFERLVRVIQNKQSNYDTDVFTGTIHATEIITGKKYDYSDSRQAVAFRVIADHIRAIAFTIADGQLPSNTGAGYVIRRILRRAVRYYYAALEHKDALLYKLVPTIAAQFENVFPELKQQSEFVSKVVKEEEDAFMRTLAKGISYFEEHVSDLDSRLISGPFAFTLFDTYGFPIDLTLLMAREKEFDVDMEGFQRSLHEQKNRSRAATTVDTGDWIEVNDKGENIFVGYDDLTVHTTIGRYRKVKAKGKEQYQVVLNETPFYAESGGQVGDRGSLQFETGETIPVTDTKKENNLIVHFTDSIPSSLEGKVLAKVDFEFRLNTVYNHSATHLLHAALRKVLGNHVAQKGSLVSPELLRFDFSHFAKVTDEELREIELLVNRKIRENIPVVIREMPKEEAMKSGAMALFGEKYGDKVRVVTIDPEYSIELCGGTHVLNTGMIGVFSIVSESGVAAGVRRIEAVTGSVAMTLIGEKIMQVKQITELLKTKDPLRSVEKLLEDKALLEKKVESMEARHLVQVRNELLQKDEIIEGVTFVGDIVEVGNPDALKKLCYELKSKLHDYVAVLAANIGGKPFVAIGISDTVVAARQIDASRIIRETVAPLIKGGGGGQKNLATAGGQDASNLRQVIDSIRTLLKNKA